MAEKAEKKQDAKEAAPAPAAPAAHGEEAKKGGGGLLKSLPVLLGGVMLIEAIVLFAGFKFLGSGPKGASAAIVEEKDGHGAKSAGGHGGGEKGAAKGDRKSVEMPLLKLKGLNSRGGRTRLYDVRIVVAVATDHEEKVKAIIKDREATIQDRVRTIIAQSDPEKLGGGSEPGLETLRRQVKYILDEIVGEGMIEEVLVTDCTPFRTDF